MKISKIDFLKSSSNSTECPKSNLKEFAFIGRSNVGKSSLINMLFDNKNLAKISKKPGKTKLINHFIINDKILLADLKTDLKFIEYLNNIGIAFHIIFTKSDKIKKSELPKKSKNYIEKIDSHYLDNRFFISSSANNNGREEILNFIISQ